MKRSGTHKSVFNQLFIAVRKFDVKIELWVHHFIDQLENVYNNQNRAEQNG